jgi:hypothetical protein
VVKVDRDNSKAQGQEEIHVNEEGVGHLLKWESSLNQGVGDLKYPEGEKDRCDSEKDKLQNGCKVPFHKSNIQISFKSGLSALLSHGLYDYLVFLG